MDNFIVKVGPDGSFNNPGQIEFYPGDIDNFFLQLQDKRVYSTPPKSITLYFHGGLVNEAAGHAVANSLTASLCAAGTVPVFFIWETGIKETISANLAAITNNPVCKKITKIILPILTAQLGMSFGDGLARGNGLSDVEIDKQLQLEQPFEACTMYEWHKEEEPEAGFEADKQYLALLKNDLRKAVNRRPGLAEELESALEVKSEKQDDEKQTADGATSRGAPVPGWIFTRLAKAAFNIIKRMRNGTDHGFYPTVMEELIREFYIAGLGAWVWDGMKSKAQNMWKANDDRTGAGQFVGSYFLQALQQYLAVYPSTKVNLIGHSAGSISICHLLSATRRRFPNLVFQTIIFLAPACRIDLFHEQVVRFPNQFVHFRCFTMTDENECKDQLLPYVYNRSLLYLISGILEEEGKKAHVPILGLHRFFNNINRRAETERVYLEETAEFLLQHNRLVLGATPQEAGPGLRTIALKHGDFDDDHITIESINHMIGA